MIVPIQKLLLLDQVAINTFPEAAPMQNLSPLVFQEPSIFALASLITDILGLYALVRGSTVQTKAPLSVETLNN